MGPTNKALLDLFRADAALRMAQADLDAATHGVRVQKKRAELAAKSHADTTERLKRSRAQQMEMDTDLRARDARIEQLRTQQGKTENHKQFQNFLVEINTQKTERSKVEERAVAKLAEVEQLQAQEAQLREAAAAERQRAEKVEAEISGKTSELGAEIRRLEPDRAAAASRVPSSALTIFDKLADNYEGEAMAGVGHIEGRTEGYYCTACNMELVVDVYNRLMTRDEVLTCPGCGRMLYVPEDLTPDRAVRQKKVVKKAAPRKKPATDRPRKKGAKVERTGRELGSDVRRIITTAAAEALRQAELTEQVPADAEIFVNGQSVGVYKVKDADTLRRLVVGKLQAEDIELDVAVKNVGGDVPLAAPDADFVTATEHSVPDTHQRVERPASVEAMKPASDGVDGAGPNDPSGMLDDDDRNELADTQHNETDEAPTSPAR